MENKSLIVKAFSQFKIDCYTFSLQEEYRIAESERSTIYMCKQINSVFKNVQVALKVFNQSRSQLELTIKAHKLFPKLNESEYIVNHYAIGVINNILALCMDFIEGSTIDYMVRNKEMTTAELKESLKGFMKAMHFMNTKTIMHNHIHLNNLFITTKNKPVLGSIKISDEKAKTSNYYEYGWLLIQLFGFYDDYEISKLKKDHIRKKYTNSSFPHTFLALLNDMIQYQQISDQDILLKEQQTILNSFENLCDNCNSFDCFMKEFSRPNDNETKIRLRMSPLKRKVIQKQQYYFINTSAIDQRDLIRAENYFQVGQTLRAQQEFQKVINKTKWQDATPIYNLAYLYFQEKDYSEAIKLFKKSIQLNPMHSSAYNLVGCTYDEMNLCKRSLKYYKQSIKLARNSGNFLNNIGIYYFKQSKYEISIKYIKKALKLEPDDDRIHGNLGMNYLKLKDYKNAKYHLKKQIIINPKTRSGYYSLAILYRLIDKIQKSIYYFRKHSQINPDSSIAINKIIYIINKSIIQDEISFKIIQKLT